MAHLRSITINTVAGLTYVTYSPVFLGLSIVTVQRSGVQYDEVSVSDINNGGTRQWALSGGMMPRIRFPLAMPFNQGEKVFVIYKSLL